MTDGRRDGRTDRRTEAIAISQSLFQKSVGINICLISLVIHLPLISNHFNRYGTLRISIIIVKIN